MGDPLSDPIDIAVGARIRARRRALGLSQQVLGDAVGVTFQQIQKYEKGSNRLGSSRLQMVARTLRVSPAYLFETNDPDSDKENESHSTEVDEFVAFPGCIELSRAFLNVTDRLVRERIVRMLEILARQNQQADAG
jgi:transcriptional regulator with XRE-family HTH domain